MPTSSKPFPSPFQLLLPIFPSSFAAALPPSAAAKPNSNRRLTMPVRTHVHQLQYLQLQHLQDLSQKDRIGFLLTTNN
jgi:hypothetical protein